ncbi:MAG: DoxX family protein [Siculibacillus sp.]
MSLDPSAVPSAAASPSPSPFTRGLSAWGGIDRLLGRVPPSLVSLALRVALAVPFFRSGLTKWDGPFRISESALFLFQEEFRLHLFGAEIAYPAPALMAIASGTAEIVLPILLVLGLATRLSAFGLLAMTALIQITVPDGWANFHLAWAAMAVAILHVGPGRIALDALRPGATQVSR